jgi:uncharacterized membrane protein YukC
MNGLRKLFIINLVLLVGLGKLMLALFNNMSGGVRYIEPKQVDCDTSTVDCDYEEFRGLVRDKTMKEIEVVVDGSPCFYKKAIVTMNEKAVFLKKLKLRIFFFVLLLIILVNGVIIYYMYVQSKRDARSKIERIYKKYKLEDYINIIEEEEPYDITQDKKNN